MQAEDGSFGGVVQTEKYGTPPQYNTGTAASAWARAAGPSPNEQNEHRAPPLRGWLYKKGAKGIKTYKKRFFVFDDATGLLHYYKQPQVRVRS